MRKRKGSGRKLLAAIVLIALLALSFISLQLFSVFEDKPVTMLQICGSATGGLDRADVAESCTAKFDGYEIITQKDSSGCTYSDWYCAPNTCNGVQAGEDDSGCPLYENNLCYAARQAYDPYQNAYCSWQTSTKDGKAYYSWFGGKSDCGLTVTAPCGTTKQYCYTYSCQSKGTMRYDIPVSNQRCGGLTRDQLSCGTGCFARFIVKKEGQVIYDTVDLIKTQDVMLIPSGVAGKATMKTLCKYSSSPDEYIACIYQDGDQAGEFAPISYCEKLYGNVLQCDDVLVDEYVTEHVLQASAGEDVTLNSKLLKVQFNYASQYSLGDCRNVQNTFQYLVPENAFQFTIDAPQQVIQGTLAEVQVRIVNSWQAVKGNLSVHYEIDTGLFNPSTETVSRIIDIPAGESVHSFPIPTAKETDSLKVLPRVYVLLEGSDFEGVNGICFGQADRDVRDLHQCEYVGIGTFTADEIEIEVMPQDAEKAGSQTEKVSSASADPNETQETGNTEDNQEAPIGEQGNFMAYYVGIGLLLVMSLFVAVAVLRKRRKKRK